MGEWLRRLFSWHVGVGAILILLILVFFVGGMLWFFYPGVQVQLLPTPVLIVVIAPTSTPVIPVQITPTVTITPSQLSQGQISVGTYVQIFDTGAAGLRLRAGPGIDQQVQFIAMEFEVFQVKAGPKDADGYTWWYLTTPNDANRNGWGASKYLNVIPMPK